MCVCGHMPQHTSCQLAEDSMGLHPGSHRKWRVERQQTGYQHITVLVPACCRGPIVRFPLGGGIDNVAFEMPTDQHLDYNHPKTLRDGEDTE